MMEIVQLSILFFFLKLVVLEAPPHPADLKAYGKLRTYFASCMAEGQDQARHASGTYLICS